MTTMLFPSSSAELAVQRATLHGLRPFPVWNGSVASPPAPRGSSSLCSVLTDSGAVVVVELGSRVHPRASAQVRKVLRPPTTAPIDCVSQCWSSDGRLLAAAFDARLVVYDAQTDFEQLAAFEMRYSAASIALVHRSSEGGQRRVFLLSGSAFGAELYQLDLPTTAGETSEQCRCQIKARAYADVAIGLVQASPDGRFAAFGSVDGRVFVRDLAPLDASEPDTLAGLGTEVMRRLLPSPRVTALAFAPSGAALLVATRKGNVFVFEYQAAAQAWQWREPTRYLGENPKTGGVASTAASTQTLATWWTPSVLAVCSRSAPSQLELFDLHSGKLLHSLVFRAAKRQGRADAYAGSSIDEWAELPLQVTGLCVTAGSRRLLCHDTSCGLMEVAWPLLGLLSASDSEDAAAPRDGESPAIENSST